MTLTLQPWYISQFQKELNAVDDALSRLNAKSFPGLKALTIPSPEWIFVAEYCPQLKSLEILSSGEDYLPTELNVDVARLGKSHPGLTRLHCYEVGMASHIHGQSLVVAKYPISNGMVDIAANLSKIEDLGLCAPFWDLSPDGSRNIMVCHLHFLFHSRQLFPRITLKRTMHLGVSKL